MSSNFFAPSDQPTNQYPQAQQQATGDFVTREDLHSYVRSEAFRSVMKNQNSDLYQFGEWSSFTPELKATTTNPILGAGSQVVGRYTRIGNTVICSFGFKFGNGGGANAGSGDWYVTLPFPAAQPSLVSAVAGVSPYSYVYAQSFQGTFYLQQWSNSTNPGRLAWGALAIETDKDTGEVVPPSRVSMYLGNLGFLGTSGGAYNPSAGEPIVDQLTFKYARKVSNDWPWDSGTPTTSSVISGQVTYEADPNAE